MKSQTKNYVIAGLTILLILLGPVIYDKSLMLQNAEETVERMTYLVDLKIPFSYNFWKERIFIQGNRTGDAVSAGMIDGQEVLLLYYVVDPNDSRF